MNILMLCTRFPYPAVNGDSVICLNRLRLLSERHAITLVCTPDAPPAEDALRYVEQFCRVVVLPRSKAAALASMAWAIVRPDMPFQVAYYASRGLRRTVSEIVREHAIDVVHMFLYRQWDAVADLTVPVLIEANDSQQLAVGHRLERARGPSRWLWRSERRRVEHFERNVPADRVHVVVLSDADAEQFGPGAAEVIPMGMDLPATVPVKAERPTVAFSGHLGYYPNIEAVEWLYTACWPHILEQVPDAQFRIIGRDPQPTILGYHDGDTVVVTGFVDTVTDEVGKAWVAMAPMSVAWGMHTKVLEALGSGSGVVLSAEAAKTFGSDVPGMRVARDADQFVDEAVTLLRDRNTAIAEGLAGRAYVAARHSWRRAGDRIERIYAMLSGAK